MISLLLLQLVREAVGVKQLHQLPSELAHLGGEFLLLRQPRRRLRIFVLMLRAQPCDSIHQPFGLTKSRTILAACRSCASRVESET